MVGPGASHTAEVSFLPSFLFLILLLLRLSVPKSARIPGHSRMPSGVTLGHIRKKAAQHHFGPEAGFPLMK